MYKQHVNKHGCSLQGSKGSTIMLTFTLELSVSFLVSLSQVCVLVSGCLYVLYSSLQNSVSVFWCLCLKYVYWHLGVSLCLILVLYPASVWHCDLASGVSFSAWKSMCICLQWVIWGTLMWCMPLCMPLAIVSYSTGHNLYVDFLGVYSFGEEGPLIKVVHFSLFFVVL
ncbi:uncharacterized protein BJ212DRAFT_1304912 [Suillus subaureus]|uniref:Uncharacterized protein n=1 Tax=Suillus subaureus TaxID=48587 RepID=A0A9P7J4D4_9AGAM|nr:uncharacterized protein BJ212DRAFT_1304912 [Suillus subaureus]KAG1801989.1 hypothetical protein BJ212DRAFT_1304912 [Suillus subaureus]